MGWLDRDWAPFGEAGVDRQRPVVAQRERGTGREARAPQRHVAQAGPVAPAAGLEREGEQPPGVAPEAAGAPEHGAADRRRPAERVDPAAGPEVVDVVAPSVQA